MSSIVSLRTVATAVASAALALSVAVGAHAGSVHSTGNGGAAPESPISLSLKDGGHWCC